MELLKKRSFAADWLGLTRASNLPTILTDAHVGIAMGILACAVARVGAPDQPLLLAATMAGMCSFYMAGMVLNGIVDRRIDAKERPDRPIASGRIRLPWAWTAFILLMTAGFFLRPSWGAAPVPIAVAGIIGVWTLSAANSMRSITLKRLAQGWCAIAVVAAIWWMVDSLLRDPFDFSQFPAETAAQLRTSHFALEGSTMLLAASLVLYNLIHAKTAWSIVLLALCRALVPVSLALAAAVSTGAVGSLISQINSMGSAGLWSPVFALVLVLAGGPLAIAIHTIVLSIVARREVAADATSYRCAKCGYALGGAADALGVRPSSAEAGRCSECGCDFATTAPLGERDLSTRSKIASAFIAPLGVIPIFVLFAPALILVLRQPPIPLPAAGSTHDILGFAVPAPVYMGVATLLLLVCSIWFGLAATRGYRAAISHASRRPAGVGAMIAAFTLLDAAAVVAYGAPELAVICLALWFATRALQRIIPAS